MSVPVRPELNQPVKQLTHPADGVPDAAEPEIFQITNMFVATLRGQRSPQKNSCRFFEEGAGGVRFLFTSTALVFLSLNGVLCEPILICVC